MNYEFHLQDPTSAATIYLFEAIIGAAKGAAAGEGIFAFASRAGVESLLGDPETQQFLSQSTMTLLIGIDAVTNRDTLVRLRELEAEYKRLSVFVFWNKTDALFHPKIARFQYPDGRRSLIVGSGNLTPGGLRQNFEAYSILWTDPEEDLDVASWDRFLEEHASEIRPIDDEALERAARNRPPVRRSRRDIEPQPGTQDDEAELPVGATDRFLVAQVPKAGDRWHQVHFNVEVIEVFFRVQPNTTQRVYLREVRHDGTFADQEVRPCVYSTTNKNLKIEVASHHGEPYPSGGPPVAVYRELQARSFAYMLLMPGDPGYDEMLALTDKLKRIGRGLPRVIADTATIAAAWPACPLVSAIDALAGEED